MQTQTENIQRIWTNVNGLQIHTLISENKHFSEKKPIVLIHGLGISNRYLIPVMSEFAKHTNVFAPDLPGWGDSTKPKRVLTISEHADVLAEWMKVSEIKSAVFLGHSYGSQIVAEFAVRYATLADALILAAPTFEIGKRHFLPQFWRLLLNAPREPLSLIYIALRDYLKFGFRREVYTLKDALPDKIETKLGRVHIPTLLVRGERDPVVTQNWLNQLTEITTNGKSITILKGTHGVIYQSYERFAEVVLEFLGY